MRRESFFVPCFLVPTLRVGTACYHFCVKASGSSVKGDSPIFADTKMGTVPVGVRIFVTDHGPVEAASRRVVLSGSGPGHRHKTARRRFYDYQPVNGYEFWTNWTKVDVRGGAAQVCSTLL